MALFFLLIAALISLAELPVPHHAATEAPAQAYWKAKLGQTPMPKVILDSLNGSKDGIINVNPNIIPQLFLTYSPLAKTLSDDKTLSTSNIKKYSLTKPTQVYSEASPNVDPELIADKSILFFLQKDLTTPVTNMNLHFTTSDEKSKFLPSQLAKSIPFSSNKLPKILSILSIPPKSATAKLVEEMIKMCEAKTIQGEEKSCTTSLESMVDYAVTHVGNKVEVHSTEINRETQSEYMVHTAVKIQKSGGNNLVCHKLSYPYAVFYCHKIENTDVYDVLLVDVADNGKKVKAIAVCHKDTSNWNSGHVAFKLLNVKPGSVAICHFLNEDTIVWVPTN